MKRRLPVLLSALLTAAIVGGLAAPSSAEIILRQKYPMQGKTTEVFVQADDGAPVSGALVTVTYRPGSSVEATDTIGTTGASGRLRWTPETAGIAGINAAWADGGATSTNVSVRFSGVPLGGVVIMLLAGLLLVGGSAVRIARVLKSPD